MNKPFYTSAAVRDLEDILDFIARDKPGAAIRWTEEIEAKCLVIASSPGIGEAMPQLGPAVRASSIGRYVIFHRYANRRLEILRVLAGGREITNKKKRKKRNPSGARKRRSYVLFIDRLSCLRDILRSPFDDERLIRIG